MFTLLVFTCSRAAHGYLDCCAVLAEAAREAKENARNAGRQLTELLSIRTTLQNERDALAGQVCAREAG